MNHRVLGGGAIVCSAVVLYHWAQPLAATFGFSNCTHHSNQNTPVNPESSTSTVRKRCLSPNAIPAIKSLPELFNLQWSKGRSPRLPAQLEAEYKALIQQAQTLANDAHTVQALAHITGIPKNSRHYGTAQQLQETWSQEILQQAGSHYQQADVSTAITLLEAIPDNSSASAHATELQQRWKQHSILLNRAIAAKDAGDWQRVIQQVESLQETPLFNSLPVQTLFQQAMNHLLEPDPALLAMASTTPGWSDPAPIPMTALSSPNPENLASLPIEPIPEPSSLNIELVNALKFIPPIAGKPPKVPQQTLRNSSMPSVVLPSLKS